MAEEAEQLASSWTDGALVFDYQQGEGGSAMIRAAAFVYPGVDSLAWVEPSYLDPYGASSPALHTRTGKLEKAPGDGFQLTLEDGKKIVALPVNDGGELVGNALLWFSNYLILNKIDFNEERERVREMIADPIE